MPSLAETVPTSAQRRALSGWGRTASTVATVAAPRTSDEVAALVASADTRGVVARGLGRSYGDAAQNSGGLVLDMSGLDRIHAVDVDGAQLDADAGVSLDRLLRLLLPLGLTLPVQPGTRQVTLGGAIGSDVHGKNHHVDGSFGHHLVSIDLVTADGVPRRLTPDGPDHELFWATVGGMGLTGVVVRARLSCRRVETTYVVTETSRAAELDEVMAQLVEGDRHAPYSVAWFDSLAGGQHLGRGVVMHGRDALLDDLPARLRPNTRRLLSERSLAVPAQMPRLVNRVSGRAFNEAWFRKAPRRPRHSVEAVFPFFHPLDAVAGWNTLYGSRGLTQYQLVVPQTATGTVHDVVEEVVASGHVSCLNVLKRFGPGDPAPLSFPMPGWTLAMDFPVRPGLARLFARLDELVLAAGGRLYLAKDARVGPAALARMYPRLDEFRETRARVDASGRFVSDLARRLHLDRRTPEDDPFLLDDPARTVPA